MMSWYCGGACDATGLASTLLNCSAEACLFLLLAHVMATITLIITATTDTDTATMIHIAQRGIAVTKKIYTIYYTIFKFDLQPTLFVPGGETTQNERLL